ncbi:MAG TPA: 50S ribosomal protein L17 [Armatimonadota bacterium]|jgi:large subunit ribosomal protein L17
MRHLKNHRRLGRATDQRTALLRSQTDSLLRHNRIKTTLQKAKETARFAEKLITLAKRGDLAARRLVLRDVHDPELVGHLFAEIAPRYTTRPGGYTRIIHAGTRRGDAAEMAVLELLD